MVRSRSTVVLLSLLAFAACGDDGGSSDGGLNPHIAEPPPAGDAIGGAHAGTWDIELYTTACTGQCSVDSLLGELSICDVGDTDSESVEVTQTDGTLRFDVGSTPSRYDGGVDADGGFDVLGIATESGGDVEIRVRVRGDFAGDSITGAARGHTQGSYDGSPVDCWYDIEVSGSRT